MTLSMILSQIY
jgi:hypothetical protein